MVSLTVTMVRSGSAIVILMMALFCAACGDRDQEFATVRNPAPAASKPMAGGTVADSPAATRMVSDGPVSDTAASIGAAGQDADSVDVDLPDLSAPMSFEVTAKVMHDVIMLRSDNVSDMAGIACDLRGVPGTSADGKLQERYDLNVMRFAHFGRADSPYAFRWVLYMPKGAGRLTGKRLPNGRYAVELRGDLRFDVILKGATEPMHTSAATIPVFRGTAKAWPPYGLTLTLANGPIAFYSDRQKRDSGITPLVTVLETKFGLGKQPTEYFTLAPRIENAAVVDPSGAPWKGGPLGGVELTWTSTAGLLKPIAVAGYNIYRSATPENPKSWRRIASVSASRTSLRDKSYDGTSKAAYMVTHRASYPTGYEYEGVHNAPVVVGPVR